MFCTNCGKTIEEGKFCSSCGAPIGYVKKSEGKVWFRISKVVYIFIYGFLILIAAAVIISDYPQQIIDQNASQITCTDGNSYSLNQAGIYALGNQNQLTGIDDQDARNFCAYGNIFNEWDGSINYSYSPVYSYPNYGEWLLYSLLGLVGVWVFMKLIKVAAVYIVTGEKPKWKAELKLIL